MDWEDARVQLIDLPPITADYMEGYISSMVRSADAALLLVDLGDDDGPFAAEAVLERLQATKTVLLGQLPARDPRRLGGAEAHDPRPFDGRTQVRGD